MARGGEEDKSPPHYWTVGLACVWIRSVRGSTLKNGSVVSYTHRKSQPIYRLFFNMLNVWRCAESTQLFARRRKVLTTLKCRIIGLTGNSRRIKERITGINC